MKVSSDQFAVDAYVWGYPLVVTHRTRALLCSLSGQGALTHRDRLATPADRAVVAPNNDTLYSSGWFDLRHGDVVVDVPAMDHPRRYWNVMMLDAYTHVTYLARRHFGTSGCNVRLTLDPHAEPVRGAADVLPIATPTVWVIVRVLVSGPDDLAAAGAIQHKFSATAPPGHPTGPTRRIGRPNQIHVAGAAYFDELRAALDVDPPAPWHPQLPAAEWDLLTRLVDLAPDKRDAGVAAGEARLVEHGVANDIHANGWGTRLRGADFGHDVLARAAAAKYILAGHHPEENRAYITDHDASGNPLVGDKPVTLRFAPGGTPPCDGFWSLTPYDENMYLAENAIGRYAIGDRTEGLRYDDDGSLTLTIGGPPPADPSNWLPTPPGHYRLGLRVYEGHSDVVEATWFPPELTQDVPR